MRKILLTFLGAVFVITAAFAQEKSVSGKVTAEDGSSLPGVNVVLKGTTSGTVTDSDGNYKLNVPETGSVIVFSFIGFATTEMTVGNQSIIDLTMATEFTQLTEVVVTAFGVKQEKKALGYGVTTISSDLIDARPESDIARVLRGKAPGVVISSTSGLAGSGTNVIIRGYSSISGSNQPLFVVDGIPFNTDTNTGNQGFGTGSATASNRFLDLDPRNIAEITILKGLSATVLYGEYGRNGVILVTTKNGQGGTGANKKMEISFSQNVSVSQVANIPDYQNTFGNGFSAGFGWFFSNWGAAFADLDASSYGSDYQGTTTVNGFEQVLITHPYDQTQYNDDFPEYIGAEYPYEPHKSVEEFFQKGISSNTSLAIQGGLGENGSFSATYSYLSDEGFTPKLDELRDGGRSNYLDKHNFGLGIQGQMQNGLRAKISLNYVNLDRLTPITAPAFGGDGNGLFAAILFTPRSMDLMGLPYQSPIDGSNVYYRRGSPIQNPRWTLNNSGQSEVVNRFFSSTEFSFDIGENWTALYRLSLDNYNQKNVRHINKGGARVPDGEMRTFNTNNTLTDHIFNMLFDYDLSEVWSLNGVIGFNSRREVKDETGTLSTQQFVYNLVTHDNYISHDAFSRYREENTLGVFTTATIGYNSYLFLNLQGRYDKTSTLEEENRSIFYPSASVSWILTDHIEAISYSSVLNYLKLRFGYGTSAGYPEPYRTRNTLNSATNQFVSGGGTILNTNSVSNRLGNKNLTPELHSEIEAGIEAQMFKSIVGIDLSVYRKTSTDLIIELPLDPATGFTVTTVNAAEIENKGVELGLTIKPPLGGAWNWSMLFNYTKNINTVNSILEGIERVQVSGFTNLGNYAIPGERYGVIYGESFLKNDEGLFVVDNQGSYQSSGNFEVIGDPNPNYMLTWINSLSWKGITFGLQFDYIDGGDMSSSTVQALLARGNTVDTDVDRNVPLIMPNSVKQTGSDSDGNPIYVPNDIQTYIGDSFFRGYFFADEGGIFDATVIRLREVSLGYTIPASALSNTPFGSISIQFVGENLFFSAPNFPKGINFDPEISSTGVGNGRGFDFRTAPTAKKYGFNIALTF